MIIWKTISFLPIMTFSSWSEIKIKMPQKKAWNKLVSNVELEFDLEGTEEDSRSIWS
jgi:hypothetical protein